MQDLDKLEQEIDKLKDNSRTLTKEIVALRILLAIAENIHVVAYNSKYLTEAIERMESRG